MHKEIISIKPNKLNTPSTSSSPKVSPLGKRQLTAAGMPPGHSPPSLTPEQRKVLDRMARETTFLMGLMGVIIVLALIVIMIVLG